MVDTIVFLHGWGGDEHSFAPIEPFFRANFNCIFIHFPSEPPSVWTLDDYADFVIHELNRAGVKKCHIIAHSFGARVAVLLNLRNIIQIEKMVLTGAAGIKPRFNLRVWLKIRLYKFRKRIFRQAQGGSADYKKLSPMGKATFRNIIGRDLAAEIAKIDIPTLLIFGKKDRATPIYMAKKWTNLCKSCRLIIYKHSGHFCFIDAPAQFVCDAFGFIKGV